MTDCDFFDGWHGGFHTLLTGVNEFIFTLPTSIVQSW